MTMSRSHLAAVATASLLTFAPLALPISGSATAAPTYIATCLTQSVKPTEVVIACADANRYVSHITWTNWGSATAHGKGTLAWNTCTPNCAAGKFVTRSISFSATGRKLVKGKETYTTLVGPKGSWGTTGTTWSLLLG
jgi:hypothetical protein